MARYHGTNRATRRRRWAVRLSVLILCMILCFGSVLGLVLVGARDEIVGQPNLMIILGCQVHPWRPSVLLQDRLNTAIGYLADHPDMTVVVSGGQGPDEPTSEAQAMYQYLTEHGVEHVLLEETSHNTWQNLNYTYAMLREEEFDLDDGVLIVSNGFHLTRATMLAERVGFSPISTLAAPSSHAPTRWKMYIREPLALMKSFLIDR